MAILNKSTAYQRSFLMVLTSDHITGATGKTVTVTISAAGGAFGAPTGGGTATEIANGWYYIAFSTTDTGSAGDLAVHCTATACDPTDFCDQVTNTSGGIDANLVDIAGSAVSTSTAQLGVNVVKINAQTASAAGTVTYPSGTIANTTNITAGTITTVTNLTNAATAGDLTATMKTSVQTAAAAAITAAEPVTANVTQVAGQTASAAGAVTFPATIASATNITAGTITTVTNLTNAATAGDLTATMKTSVQTAAAAAITAAEPVTANVTQWNSTNVATPNTAGVPIVDPRNVIRVNTAQATGDSTTAIKLDSGASATTNFYQYHRITVISGTGAPQSAICTAYNGSTKVATVSPAWPTAPDGTSVFLITVDSQSDLDTILGTASAGTAGYIGPDWGHVNAPTSTVGLSGTTVGTVTNLTNAATSGDLTATMKTSVQTAAAAAITAAEPITANVTEIAGQTANAAGAVTFPGSIASPTNITAGTITTVTNLTNAATAGDLTATMKTSVQTAAAAAITAAEPITANVTQIKGTASAGATGYVGIDWGNINAPTTTVGLTGTTIGTATNLTNAATAGDLTSTMKTSVQTAAAAAITAAEPITANVTEIAGQTASAVGSVAFPGTVASPTNITAGTITTVTNLTNAATVGDLTSTMKTSVQTASAAAITAAEPITANITQVAGNADAATNISKNLRLRGTVTTGASTTSIPTSAFTITGAANQFVARALVFDVDTTTAGLQGEGTLISANTASATPTFTVGTLTTTPASGDTFSLV